MEDLYGGIFFIVVIGFIFSVFFTIYKHEKNLSSSMKKNETPAPLKTVKLFTEDGTLLETYTGVCLEHWGKNIYNIYTKNGGEFIIRIDKGANMLLTSENIS